MAYDFCNSRRTTSGLMDGIARHSVHFNAICILGRQTRLSESFGKEVSDQNCEHIRLGRSMAALNQVSMLTNSHAVPYSVGTNIRGFA